MKENDKMKAAERLSDGIGRISTVRPDIIADAEIQKDTHTKSQGSRGGSRLTEALIAVAGILILGGIIWGVLWNRGSSDVQNNTQDNEATHNINSVEKESFEKLEKTTHLELSPEEEEFNNQVASATQDMMMLMAPVEGVYPGIPKDFPEEYGGYYLEGKQMIICVTNTETAEKWGEALSQYPIVSFRIVEKSYRYLREIQIEAINRCYGKINKYACTINEKENKVKVLISEEEYDEATDILKGLDLEIVSVPDSDLNFLNEGN